MSPRAKKPGTQKIIAPVGQPYGEQVAQIRRQQDVPATGAPAPGAGMPTPIRPSQLGPAPGTLTPLDAPTTRPDEPVTAGLPIGAGSSLSPRMDKPLDPADVELRALYLQFPNNHLRELIEELDLENEV